MKKKTSNPIEKKKKQTNPIKDEKLNSKKGEEIKNKK